MSKVFNMVGGGSGKNISSIIINGLGSTDAVTCTKDDKTYPATWDETTKHWEIVGLPLGTFTVTATNGTKTTTETVLIDIAGVYDIEMKYALWLYRNGDECEDVTGGWNKATLSAFEANWYNGDSYITVTKSDASMTLQQNPAGGYRCSCLSTLQKVNVKDYSKVYATVTVTKGDYYWWLRLSANETLIHVSSGVIDTDKNNGKTITVEFDVSSMTSDCYVYFFTGCDSSMTTYGTIDILKVWLE